MAGSNRMRTWQALIGSVLVGVLWSLWLQAPPARAQAPSGSGGPVEPAVIEDLVAANRILADQGVLDGFGHVSMRHPADPGRYPLAPRLLQLYSAVLDRRYS